MGQTVISNQNGSSQNEKKEEHILRDSTFKEYLKIFHCTKLATFKAMLENPGKIHGKFWKECTDHDLWNIYAISDTKEYSGSGEYHHAKNGIGISIKSQALSHLIERGCVYPNIFKQMFRKAKDAHEIGLLSSYESRVAEKWEEIKKVILLDEKWEQENKDWLQRKVELTKAT